MKKRIIFILLLVMAIGCRNIMNTPTHKVESFLHKYQNLDKSILKELDLVLEKDKDMDLEQKNTYRSLLKRQYQNLSYKIKSEKVIQDIAVVECEIEVFDYKMVIKKVKENSKDLEKKEYIDYQLEEMGKVNSIVKYPITFHLREKKGIWEIEEVTDYDRMKIHGLY